MPRANTNTPEFDDAAMSLLGEDDQQPQQQQDHTQEDDQQSSGQSEQSSQQQPDHQSNIDDAIARADGTQPKQQQQPDPNKQKQQQQKQQPLLDEQGRPVAHNARHHFFARKKAEEKATKLQSQLDTTVGQLRAFQTLHQQMQQSGLSAQEQAVAISLGVGLKTKPLETVKQLLTELKSAGINIDGALGVNTLDTSAIAHLIDSKLKPFTDAASQRRAQEEDHAAISEEVNEWFGENEDALIHADVINGLLQRFPNWSLDKAWSEVRVGATKAGFDLSQPLKPQYAARRGNPQGRPVQNGGARVPMTNGGGRGSNTANFQQPPGKSFDHNARTGDIVLDAMRAAGMDTSRLT